MDLDHHHLGIKENQYETPIYRFTRVKWLLDLMVQKRNILVSPRKWDDPYENALASSLRFQRKDGSRIQYGLRNRVYGQCWTFRQETDAFWRMYVPEGDGVCLKSTIRKLFRSLQISLVSGFSTSCFIGCVRYEKAEVINTLFNKEKWVKRHFLHEGTLGHAKSMLLKRREFHLESEVRLLYLDPHNIDHGDFFAYKIDPSSTILEITFDPRMEDTLFNTYETILGKLGYRGAIRKSELYKAPQISLCV